MKELEVKDFGFKDVEDVEKGFILCHPNDVLLVTGVIKQWIASILAEHYEKDPQKMIEANKHVLQFQAIKWLTKIVLITNK